MTLPGIDKRIVAGLFSVLAMSMTGLARAGVIDAELESILQAAKPNQNIPVILRLADRVDLRAFKDPDRRIRRSKMLKAFKSKEDVSQKAVRNLLAKRKAKRIRRLWMINGSAFVANSAVIRELAGRSDVESIRLDQAVSVPEISAGTSAAPEWNLEAIQVPKLWNLGYFGAGIVVANMDSGVDVEHPELSAKWRGGLNSWFDPHGEHATPYDSQGHGTQAMGIMVGGNAGGTSIGVAPGARWIAVKLFDDAGQAKWSDIHLSFQWLLDPDGDPNTADAPQVVNASWGLTGSISQCNLEFNNDIKALKTANIAVVFSGGNDGPAAQTSVSPANNPDGFSVGAVDSSLTVANFSSRGESACDGSIYPRVTAPGVNINTTDLSFGGMPLYSIVSGSSYAAPHTAGIMALMLDAFPNANVMLLEAAVQQTALDLGEAGADNSYGYGLVDALAAYNYLLGYASANGKPPMINSTPITSAIQGQPYAYAVTATDPDGDELVFSLISAPANMSIDPTTGSIAWTPGNAQVGSNGVVVKVADSRGLSTTQNFNIDVANVNDPPEAANDAYRVNPWGTLVVAASGLLGNDSDPDGNLMTVRRVSGPTSGKLTLNSNGGFIYTPAPWFTGVSRFTYQATDGALSSKPATVAIAVNANKAPIAVNDVVGTRKNAGLSIAVLANDSDPDGSLNPESIRINIKPNKGGTAKSDAIGTVTYQPKLNFTGTERFAYSVKDDSGKLSKRAVVTVTVTD